MVSQSLILGYHGCDLSTAERVALGKEELRKSTNAYDWLGSGMYFWEDSPDRAYRWAKENQSGKIKKPAVLGAIIDLGHCLNLIDTEHLALVRAAHDAYMVLCKKSGLTPAVNAGHGMKARYLDQAVFHTLHQLREADNDQPFHTVRAFFVEGESLYPNSGLRTMDHIQICVRKPDSIIGYFLPR
jgi:hypothetical protein